MNVGEILQASQTPEARHAAFSPSERLMRILGANVQPASGHLAGSIADFLHPGAKGSWSVGYGMFAPTMAFHQFPEEFQRGRAISLL